MDNKFNFSEVGKRMPYTVPDGCMDAIEANVLNAVKDEQPQPMCIADGRARRRPVVMRIVWSVAAVAASLALFFVVHGKLAAPAADPYSEVDQAYAQLSQADQQYLLEIYEDDLLLSE